MLWTIIFLTKKYERIKEALQREDKEKLETKTCKELTISTTDLESKRKDMRLDSIYDLSEVFPLKRYDSFFEELKHQKPLEIMYFPVFLSHRTVIAYLLIFGSPSYFI